MLKRIIFPGLVASVAMLAIGMMVSQVFSWIAPSLVTEYQNASLFRPWSDPAMSLFFLNPFLLGFLLSWVWDKIKIVFINKNAWKSGVNFGGAYWLLSITGMIMSYSTFPVSVIMVLSWTVSGLLEALLAGVILSRMNKPGHSS